MELDPPEFLNAMLPGLGYDWGMILAGEATNCFYHMAHYASEWEVLVAHWAEGDYAQLQPEEPCWLWPMLMVLVTLLQKIAKKERELCGQLSAYSK